MTKENWGDIYEGFSEYYQKYWEEKNFTYQEAKSWTEKGLKSDDYNFAYYLRKDNYQPNDLNKNNLEELRKKVSWQDIHKDFSPWIWNRKTWENQGFNAQETKQWIEIGFTPDNSEEAQSWKAYNFTTRHVKELIEAEFSLSDWEYAEQWRELGFNLKEIKEWVKTGLRPQEPTFTLYLKKNGYHPSKLSTGDLFQLRKEFYPGYPWVQAYLNKNYPPCNCERNDRYKLLSCARKNFLELNFRNLNLKGDLDLECFWRLEKIYLAGNPCLGKVKNKSWNAPIIYKNSSEWSNYQHLNQNQAETIDLNNLDFEELDGLIIENYPNLEEIEKKHHIEEKYNNEHKKITKVVINDCLQLKRMNITNFKNNRQLIIRNLPNLEKFHCWENQLKTLDLTNCANLERINCSNNQLAEIKLPIQGEKLEYLNLSNNKFNQDLSLLSHLVNLKGLYLGNNKFYGSLEPLKNMNKLEFLSVSNTDVNSGLEYLLENVKGFNCSVNYRKDAKIKIIYDLFADELGKIDADTYGIKNFSQKLRDYKQWRKLDFSEEEIKEWTINGAVLDDHRFVTWLRDIKNYGLEWIVNYKDDYRNLSNRFKKYGLCSECKQPNTGEKWCKDCNAKHSETRFAQLSQSKNLQIDQFIQKYQLQATGKDKFIEWIPYEQFTDTEYLTQGGFGKVYKAKWKEGNVSHWDIKNKQWQREKDYEYENKDKWNEKKNYKDCKIVVLKSLNYSQNNTEFLQEIEKHKIIDDWFNNIVPCYGLSQDSSGNYLMVMKYMPEGDLRQYLSNKNWELSLKDKISHLAKIAQGLKDIHAKNLVHQDFHSGNILKGIEQNSCLITDLGLCKPVDKGDKEKEIFGVLPYVAPEVLNGMSSKFYTLKSDIYSFGIIAYEIFSGLPPYYDKEHDASLGVTICCGLRPQFQIKIPQLLEDLIKRCWEVDPAKRPTAIELERTLRSWEQGNEEFKIQLQEAEEYNKTLPDEIKYPDYKKKMHTGAIYTSRLLPTKEITELLQNCQKASIDEYVSEELNLDIDNFTENVSQDLASRTKRQLSLESQTKTNQGETKSIKIDKEQGYQAEPVEIDYNWTNIHRNFTFELIQVWQNQGFTYEQARDWINIHSPNDQSQEIQQPEFYAWLRDHKNLTPEQVLNDNTIEFEALKVEFKQNQFQTQIIHNPSRNN